MSIARTLEKRRGKLGWSYQRVRDGVYDLLGPGRTPSHETIRRVHSMDDVYIDPLLLGAICDAMGLHLRDVSPETADFFVRITPRLIEWGGVVDVSDQPEQTRSCTGKYWVRLPKLFDDTYLVRTERERRADMIRSLALLRTPA